MLSGLQWWQNWRWWNWLLIFQFDVSDERRDDPLTPITNWQSTESPRLWKFTDCKNAVITISKMIRLATSWNVAARNHHFICLLLLIRSATIQLSIVYEMHAHLTMWCGTESTSAHCFPYSFFQFYGKENLLLFFPAQRICQHRNKSLTDYNNSCSGKSACHIFPPSRL